MSRPFAASYLAGEESALRLLPASPRDRDARRVAVEHAAARRVAPELVAALRAFDARLSPSVARRAHLDRLAAGGAAVVVTGQQVGLFLGPLYTLHKAASAVAFARQLEAETGVPCVPLFWLQVEDHDWDEVRACHVATSGGTALLALPPDTTPSRVSLAHRHLAGEVAALVAQLGELVEELPHAGEVMALVADCWRPGRSPGDAFAHAIASLFAREGLVLLDPRDATVARRAAPLHQAALARADEIDAILVERSRALADAGFAEQVHPRPGSSLSFFHEHGAHGPRYRLERDGAGWRSSSGRVWSQAELEAELERDPLTFSTSALLRPLVQDTLLPTAAYIGGPGEIGYFAQCAPLYDLLGVRLPRIASRARLRIVEPAIARALSSLGLRAADAERPRRALLDELAARSQHASPDPAALRATLLGDLEARLDAARPTVTSVESRLDRGLERTRASVLRAIDRLVARYARARAERDTVSADRVDRVRAALFPDDTPQERRVGFMSFAARVGSQALVDAVLGAALPLDGAVREITP